LIFVGDQNMKKVFVNMVPTLSFASKELGGNGVKKSVMSKEGLVEKLDCLEVLLISYVTLVIHCGSNRTPKSPGKNFRFRDC
jgi:hypothetical protein